MRTPTSLCFGSPVWKEADLIKRRGQHHRATRAATLLRALPSLQRSTGEQAFCDTGPLANQTQRRHRNDSSDRLGQQDVGTFAVVQWKWLDYRAELGAILDELADRS